MKHFIRGIILSLVCVLFAPSNFAFASANDFYFKDFTADYYLTKNEDGVSILRVKEVLTAVFPMIDQNHGITREIPYLNQNGKNLTIDDSRTFSISALRNGSAENISRIDKMDGYYLVYLGNADTFVHGEQVYTLEYEFMNVITEFDQNKNNISGENKNVAFQELYWDTNGTGWSQPFEKLTARLHVSDEILKNMNDQIDCYVGAYGEIGSSRCIATKNADGYTFSTQDLLAGQNLTFVTSFRPDTFKVVKKRSYALVLIFIVEIIIITILLLRKLKKWRGSAKDNYELYNSLFVKPEYQPPKDVLIHVAEGGQVFMGKAKSSYVATLLELAVSHAISIIKKTGENDKNESWAVRVNVEPGNLSKSQIAVLRILANSKNVEKDDEITIEEHKPTMILAGYAKDYKRYADAMLIREKYLDKRRDKETEYYTNITSAFVSGFILLGTLYFIRNSSISELIFTKSYVDVIGSRYLPVLIVLALIFYAVVKTIIDRKIIRYSNYTEKGIRLVRYLEGLELYIKMAEADRLKFLQSVKGADVSNAGIVKLYEKLLPWAGLFGEEESWAKELSKYYQVENVPEEIEPDFLNSIVTSNILSNFENNIKSSTSYISPSSGGGGGGGSSFSSGGGGGGFSGGGGGGGGGGGW